MKKVMIGILILIPVLILVIVAAISNFLKMTAWIAVDDIMVVYKDTTQEAESIDIVFSGDQITGKFDDIVSVKVMPDYANRYTIEWRISGDVECMDERYQQEYEKYLSELEAYNKYLSDYAYYDNLIKKLEEESKKAATQLEKDLAAVDADPSLGFFEKRDKKEELQEAYDLAQEQREADSADAKVKRDRLVEPEVVEVAPPAMLVDDSGNPVTSNTSSKFVINSYCRFNLTVQVENVSRTLSVTVKGYNVEHVSIVNIGSDDATLKVGEKMRVGVNYTPVSSIVSETIWESDNPSVATVDGNGVITAHAIGSANIKVKANRYDDKEQYVESEAYAVNVVAGVSKFGSEFSTSKDSFTLSEIGVESATAIDGCTVDNGIVAFNAGATAAHISTSNGDITINKCDENDIAIENAEIYSALSGYVFEVSELTLKLRAVWKDVLKDGTPDGVQWAVNNSKLATVTADGKVSAKASGLVDVTATRDGKSAKLALNMQVKLVSMKLRTGEAYYQVGLALETVFAAQRFADVTVNNDKVDNSTLIEIIGAPKLTDFETESDYKNQLIIFYSAYNYEIVEGGEYAHFSENATEPNRLIFNPTALEGKGKQNIKIKVSAKYPKYEGESTAKFTEEYVTIQAVYGVEVNDIVELRQASEDQKTYAYADGNLKPSEVFWTHTNTERGRNDFYRSHNSAYSLNMYAISMMSDVAFEDNLNISCGNDIKIYGDLYGNGKMLRSAYNEQVYNVDGMLWIGWSNVTVSNLTIRANKFDKDGTLSAEDVDNLRGACLEIRAFDDYERFRITGANVEFCILENARRAVTSYNADVNFNGIVVRNIDDVAFFVRTGMNSFWEQDDKGNEGWVTYPIYSHIGYHNCVFSNCISTIASFSYERFTIMSDPNTNRNPFLDCKVGDGRFIRDDLEANAEYFKKYFIPAGINTVVRQTGFLDIYNWQNVKNVNFIDVGDNDLNQLIGMFAGEVFKSTKEFEKCRYYDAENNENYIHMGILSSGISFDEGIMDEPSYLDIKFQDLRFSTSKEVDEDGFVKVLDPIRTRNIPDSDNNALASIMNKMEIMFYSYVSGSELLDIYPNDMYEMNSQFIARLHS